jgi:hypothetical protein
MIISVAGMPQSGSTMLFNIVSELFNIHNVKYESCLFGPKTYNRSLSFDDLILRSKNNLFLVKEHHYQEDLESISDFVIVSKRKIKDSIASRRRRGKGLFSKGKRMRGLHQYDEKIEPYRAFKEWCVYLTKDCYEDWLNSCSEEKILVFDYDTYIDSEESKEDFIKNLSDLLKLNTNDQQVSKLIDCVKIENLKNNPVANQKNFFSMNRITNKDNKLKVEDSLSEEEVNYINKNYPNYC